jgi:hypothetical protein
MFRIKNVPGEQKLVASTIDPHPRRDKGRRSHKHRHYIDGISQFVPNHQYNLISFIPKSFTSYHIILSLSEEPHSRTMQAALNNRGIECPTVRFKRRFSPFRSALQSIVIQHDASRHADYHQDNHGGSSQAFC